MFTIMLLLKNMLIFLPCCFERHPRHQGKWAIHKVLLNTQKKQKIEMNIFFLLSLIKILGVRFNSSRTKKFSCVFKRKSHPWYCCCNENILVDFFFLKKINSEKFEFKHPPGVFGTQKIKHCASLHESKWNFIVCFSCSSWRKCKK